MANIRLSKSALEKFRACPRCFWLEKNRDLKQPDGIRSGLPMGMDRVLKAHYDAHRARLEAPPELKAQLPGWTLYPDQAKLKDIRNWRRGLTVMVDRYELSTALDDVVGNGSLYAMLDYKTKAKATNAEDTQKYYGVQADCYDLALNTNKMPTDHRAHFAYYYPENVGPMSSIEPPEAGGLSMGWRCQLISIPADPERAKALVVAAGQCLEGPEPPAASECGYCYFVEARKQQAPAAV